MSDTETNLTEHIRSLQAEHRALDVRIDELQQNPYQDQLLLQRLKKRKLYLKDTIQRLRAQLIPDLDA